MTDAHEYEDSTGRSWRIRLVQVVDTDPMFDGVVHRLSVDPADAATTDQGEGGFEVTVRYAPIFYGLLTLQQRRQLRERSGALLQSLLDRGHRGATEIRVTSDGAAMHRGEILEWCLPLRQSA